MGNKQSILVAIFNNQIHILFRSTFPFMETFSEEMFNRLTRSIVRTVLQWRIMAMMRMPISCLDIASINFNCLLVCLFKIVILVSWTCERQMTVFGQLFKIMDEKRDKNMCNSMKKEISRPFFASYWQSLLFIQC